MGDAIEIDVGLIVKISGQILSRRVQDLERIQIVDHLVVQAVHDGLQGFLQLAKVEQQTGFVEFLTGQGDSYLVIVAVRIFALAFVIAQVVARRKRIFYSDLKHESLSRRVRTQTSPGAAPKPTILPR